ncbi:MAG: DUF177 domain-containing protein [Betaproteobacteria bacterium]|nr:DUF177 domain-containing protein [Betaproteobacteria bacterium]NDD13337.1 DUF177 domain-containing protein [Betaproteobacteria bacterium]
MQVFFASSTPRALDVQAFASENGVLDGVDAIALYPRLSADLLKLDEASPDRDSIKVHWHAEGQLLHKSRAAPQVWLHLGAQVTLPMTCQRCLKPVKLLVEAKRSFRFVGSEQEAEFEDDEAEEDLLVLTKRFDLHALVEDELLMAMPMVPMHNTCPEPQIFTAQDPDFELQEAAASRPFAVLASLKGDKH